MNFAMVMDISILVLLAATVFLAFRLTMSLRHFRESRSEMEGLVNRLTANIDKAERAIGGMQNAARNAGKELDEIISDAKALSNELKLMTQTGDSLANRLEKLAERNRELVDKIENAGGLGALPSSYHEPVSNKPAPKSIPRPANTSAEPSGFAIRDREYSEGFEDEDLDFESEMGQLQSQAERELFEALQTNKDRIRKIGTTQ